MRRAPMPRKRPTVLRACVPRVRSARSVEGCGAVQSPRPAQRASLARASSVPATAATRPARFVTALAPFGALRALLAFLTLFPGFGADCGKRLNHLPRSLHRFATNRGDRNHASVFDADLRASLFLDTADRLALWSDEIADLLRIDLHCDDTRSVLGQICARLGKRLSHLTEDVESTLARLG